MNTLKSSVTTLLIASSLFCNSCATQSYRTGEWPRALQMADFILSAQHPSGAIPDSIRGLSVNQDSVPGKSSQEGAVRDLPAVKRIADFILSLQNAAGAIQDEPGVKVVNQDSNMEYALIGLGAAYAATSDKKYLAGFENGIKWLADREEMSDPEWKGSWFYVFSPEPPYAPIPTSPEDPKISDVRGVDATSTLFVYLLHLDKQLTGSDALARKYAVNAEAALDFVVNHNLDKDGFSWSSWQLHTDDNKWHQYQFKYSADQGDVYLGMQAGAELYKSRKYASIADFLRKQTPALFFSNFDHRYALGLGQDGKIAPTAYVFAQGYLPWMWGDSKESRAALNWLRAKVRADGSIIDKPGETPSSLSVAVLGMAGAALKKPPPIKSFQWLISTPTDPNTGGIHENLTPNSHVYNNVAGFCVIALTGFLPFDQPARISEGDSVKSPPSNWTTWYPDSTAQLFPMSFGIISPRYPFNAKWSNWTQLGFRDAFPRVVVSGAAALRGDFASVNKYINTIQSKYVNTGFPYPWYCAEAGWFIRVNHYVQGGRPL
jgi:hypothetical protein